MTLNCSPLNGKNYKMRYNKTMEQLIQALRVLLSDTVALKFKAHGYHWNVEGDDFPQFHDFFGDIYEDYESATDTYAEWIRKLDSYAPFKLSRFMELNEVGEPDVSSDPMMMCADLLMCNDTVLTKLMDAVEMATAARQHALANFFAERMDQHQRWHWMLSASLKKNEIE
jgi:starvation-inducible DNA-binding protein